MEVLQKFLRYVQVDTPSDDNNFDNTPSTKCQFDLANLLADELKGMGLEATVTANGYVYSCIPSNCKCSSSVGFIAHIDVVSEPCGKGVKPFVLKGYSGGDICQPNGNIIKVEEFPQLKNYVGEDIVTSGGDTILGADDKAGVAEIMEMCEYLLSHPEIKHGKIGIAFTPDEEIGHGAHLFDVKGFGCDYAYTVDGEEIGEICYETFNGAAFDIEIDGVNIHPGQAKGKMINAIILANELISCLPADERPETTEGREGYYFINQIAGGVERCKVSGIIRDHDRNLFEKRKAFIVDLVAKLNKKYSVRFALSLRDQYYNCAEVIEPHMQIVDDVKNAMVAEGVTPLVSPIRGGTDGSSLSFMGLPCPNICTGGHNAHSTSEFIPVGSMEKVVNILLRVVSEVAKRG
jgi:tripeptide aminopeptidase